MQLRGMAGRNVQLICRGYRVPLPVIVGELERGCGLKLIYACTYGSLAHCGEMETSPALLFARRL